MNDFELVQLSLSNDRYKLELFQRYEGLLWKAFKDFKKKNYHSLYEFDDYKNNAYIIFVKTLASLKIEKIVHPEEWKFITFYKRALIWYNNTYFTQREQKHNKTVVFSDCYSSDSDDNQDTYFIDSLLVSEDTIHLDTMKVFCIDMFKKSLIPQETIILNHLMTKGRKNKTPSFLEVGERMGLSKQRISLIVQHMKKKWKKCQLETYTN